MTITITGGAAPITFPFSAQEIAQAVNRVPNQYGLLRELGLFPVRGVATTLVRIDVQDGQISVLPARPRGADPTQADRGSDRALFVELPSFPHQDTLTPDDLQDILRVVNGELRTESLAEAMERIILNPIRRKHDLTLEWLRIGALKGLITDGGGATLYNLYDEFGINKKSVDFVLGTDTTDVIAKCSEVISHVRENLKGETMNRVAAVVSSEWFNKFVQHPLVEKYWLNHQSAMALAQGQRTERGGQYGREFEFQGVVFREYIGSAPLATGSSARLIAANAGHAYPEGTSQETHVTFAGPPYDIRQVNQPGGAIHVSLEPLDHGRGIEVLTESCPLPIWKRPEVLVDITTSN